MEFNVVETPRIKTLVSDTYNSWFDKNTGLFVRWGVDENDDPNHCPFGPEILDVEISAASDADVERTRRMPRGSVLVTEGGCDGHCRWCYKKNHARQTVHMPLDVVKSLLNKLPPSVTQIAYGICSVSSHPQLWDIFQATRECGIVPNVTVNGRVSREEAQRIAELCGAVAVSVTPENKDVAYETIRMLSQDFGMKQVNIHVVLGEESVGFIESVVYDMTQKLGPLSNVYALVMLAFKDKAKTGAMTPISAASHSRLIRVCEAAGISYGFDSCSAHSFLKCTADRPELAQCCDACCSLRFSCYINVFGEVYACSFLEGNTQDGWGRGISIHNYKNLGEIWRRHPKVLEWRRHSIECEGSGKNPCCYPIGV